jgi:coenzyme F420-reducing hydrogenase alpha subunit
VTDGERRLQVGALARVEGEGALHVVVREGRVERADLKIYEPPRFFEAMLRGRAHTEPPDITARICGICPVAYQMSACLAIEDACGITVPRPITDLRRLLYCGEWIGSHVLHIYFLHAPDFLGYPDVVAMARDHRAHVERGLRLKKVGTRLMEVVGGRAVHPINVRLGGFHRAPTRAELAPQAEMLRRALDDALNTVRWVAGFDVPDLELGCDLLAVQHPDRYAIEEGSIGSSGGLDVPAAAFLEHVTEFQEPHSTALHARLDGRTFLTGPLARYSLGSARLPEAARAAATDSGLGPDCRNPFRSIVVRAVEVVCAVEEALRLIEAYEPPEPPAVPVPPRAGVGHGVTEAPRGLLYHRYELDDAGTVRSATIVPPTAQNQGAIEADLRHLVGTNLHLDDAELAGLCERAIRNHDPCISCAAHFLDLTVDRR